MPLSDPSLLVIVVATAPQAGKTTVACHVALRLKVDHVPSSRVVVERVERALSLSPGTIVAVRTSSPETYRPELIAEADAMRAAGVYPGVLCVEAGYRIIDGLRTEAELDATLAAAAARGLHALVLCVDRPVGAHAPDNTERDRLLARADAVVRNTGSIKDLLASVDAVLGHASSE